MDKFWQFALMLLEERKLLILAAIGATIDALCKLGGFGTLTWIVKLFLDPDVTLYGILEKKAIELQATGGADLTPWLGYVPQGQMTGLATALGCVMVLTIIGSLGRIMHAFYSQTASLTTVNKIRGRVFSKLIYMPMSVAILNRSTEQMSRVVRDSRQVASGFSILSGKVVRGVLSGVVLMIGAFILDWRLSLLFMIVVPPTFFLNRSFGKRVKKASKQTLARYGKMMSMINESLQSLRIVKIHQGESYERRRFVKRNNSMLNKEMKARKIKAVAAPVTEVITMAGVMISVLVAAWGIYRSGADPSEVVGVLAMLIGSAGSFRTLAGLNIQLNLAAAGAENLDEIMRMETEVVPLGAETREHRLLPRHRQSIVFENVRFTYPGSEEEVLHGLNLEVPHGSVCAIVGQNGSGKTTLLNLLPRLFELDSGRILIDGHDISECSLRSLRRQIAAVTQETMLFEGSVTENILYNMRDVPEADVILAAECARAHEFIEELPEGYETNIGEQGKRLSGGQRQRLAIARAIIRDPDILILDEATSQIDAHAEALISEAISSFAKGRTTFVIAHRLSTVVNADMIVVMADGRIVSVGRHDELLASSSVYQTLCKTQLHAVDPTSG